MSAILQDLRLLLFLIFLSVVITLADSLNFLELPKSTVQKITIPIQYGLYKSSLAAGSQIEFIFLARKAAKENKALNSQLAELISENAQLRRQLAEAQSFLEQQKTLNPKTFSLVPARPVGFSRFLFIDKGFSDGLKPGMIVVYKDNYIGQVKEVSSQKSSVLLASDPDSRIAAFSSNQNGRAKGILTGQFGSEMILDKILHQEPIGEGDLIYSEGAEGTVPRGLVLGRVVEVVNKDNEIFKSAKIKPVFDLTQLDVVFVITN